MGLFIRNIAMIPVEQRVLDSEEFCRKFCGCMSLRGGCAIACAIWIGINTYIATLSFRGYTPIFSYLNRSALYALGAFSIVFALSALLVLYGLFVDQPISIRRGFYPLSIIVFIYLIDFIVNIFIFGIQKPQYMNWCVNSSHNLVDEIVNGTATNGTAYIINDLPTLNIYNCQKLWEDEIKFAIVIFLIMFICYGYWTFCVLLYYEKLRELFLPTQAAMFNTNFGIQPMGYNVFHNQKPSSKSIIAG